MRLKGFVRSGMQSPPIVRRNVRDVRFVTSNGAADVDTFPVALLHIVNSCIRKHLPRVQQLVAYFTGPVASIKDCSRSICSEPIRLELFDMYKRSAWVPRRLLSKFLLGYDNSFALTMHSRILLYRGTKTSITATGQRRVMVVNDSPNNAPWKTVVAENIALIGIEKGDLKWV